MTDIYLGKMLWDESCNTSYWNLVGSVAGIGGNIDTPTVSLETSTLKHGNVSLKVVVPSGAKEYAHANHTFGTADDWTNKEYLLFWFYGINDGSNVTVEIDDGTLHSYTFVDNVGGWRFMAIHVANDVGVTTPSNITKFGFRFYAVGTFYIDFINIGCVLDFVTGYSRTRTSKIPIKKIPHGVSKRDSKVNVRDRIYNIRVRLTEVCRDCLESLDDDQAWMGLDDQRIQETVWLDTMPLEHAMGYSHEPEVTNIVLVVSAV